MWYRFPKDSSKPCTAGRADPISTGATMAAVDQIDVFLASLKRCLVQPEFLLHFYALFMDSSVLALNSMNGWDISQRLKQISERRPAGQRRLALPRAAQARAGRFDRPPNGGRAKTTAVPSSTR